MECKDVDIFFQAELLCVFVYKYYRFLNLLGHRTCQYNISIRYYYKVLKIDSGSGRYTAPVFFKHNNSFIAAVSWVAVEVYTATIYSLYPKE